MGKRTMLTATVVIAVGALLLASSASSVAATASPVAATAKKHKCKKKGRPKSKRCRKPGGSGPGNDKPGGGGGGEPVTPVPPLQCPTGAVSGSQVATVSGGGGDVNLVGYSFWDGTTIVTRDGPYGHIVQPDASGAWSFSFTPNQGPNPPASWTETIKAYNGSGGTNTCSWTVTP